MRILITGGAGYIGTEIVKHLSQDEQVEEIVVYDNLSRKNIGLFTQAYSFSHKIKFIKGDLLDTFQLTKACASIDIIIHTAAKVSTPFATEDPHQFEQINHWGTANLCTIAEKSGIKKMIYLSSTAVYGFSDELMQINSLPNPSTDYGISKWRGEAEFKRLQDKMEVVILRCGNVFGYSAAMRLDAVINKMCFEAHYYNRINIEGSGWQKRAFISIHLLIEYISQATFLLKTGIYHATHTNWSIIEIADVLKEIYPSLEFLFVNQNMQSRSLSVETDERLRNHPGSNENLKSELESLIAHFTFGRP